MTVLFSSSVRLARSIIIIIAFAVVYDHGFLGRKREKKKTNGIERIARCMNKNIVTEALNYRAGTDCMTKKKKRGKRNTKWIKRTKYNV